MARPGAHAFARQRRRPGRSAAVIADSFPLPQDRVDEILRGLGEQLAGIYEVEVDAVEATARAIAR